MEPLCTDTQAMMPCLPAQESNSISLKRHRHSSGVLTGLTHGPNWPKPLPPSPHLNYKNVFCSFDAGRSASTQGEQKGLAGNGSQLKEAAESQMARRRDHIEKEYKSMALGNPKSNLLSMCDIDLIFSEQCEHKKNPIFSIWFGQLWYVVLDPIMCPVHGNLTRAWPIRLELNSFFNPFFSFLICTHKRCTWLTVFVNVGRFMVAAI